MNRFVFSPLRSLLLAFSAIALLGTAPAYATRVKDVAGVQGVRSDEGQLVMQVAARVAISERELLIRGIAAILPEWLEQRYGLTPK